MSTSNTNRACESCRSSKVRCRPAAGSSSTSGICERCESAGKECIYSEPRRTRRKRTDVRVAALEKQVAALGELLKQSHPSEDAGVSLGRSPAYPNSLTRSDVTRSSPYQLIEDCHLPPDTVAKPTGYDPVEAGLMSMDEASRLFQRYVSYLVPQRPLVVFPSEMTAESLRRKDTVLFLAVMAASASTLPGNLGAVLSDLVRRAYAEHVIMRGEKSLELVQTMLITANWYYPPDTYGQLNFYQFIHMAATMARDIGLDSPTRSSNGSPNYSKKLECERTLLACYICCSSLSFALHRPQMLPFTRYMDECLEALRTSRDRAATDEILASWVTLQRIVDVSAPPVGSENQDTEIDFASPVAQLSIRNCTKKLQTWKENLSHDLKTGSLLIQYDALLCIVNESSLYVECDPADFKPPYSLRKLISATTHNNVQDGLTPARLSSIATCLSSTHDLFETFVSMPVEVLQCSPVTVYARLLYAVVVLIKISISTTTEGAQLHGVITHGEVNMSFYLDQVAKKLAETSDEGCRVATKFLLILRAVLGWLSGDIRDDASQEIGGPVGPEVIMPLKYLDIQDDGPKAVSGTSQSANFQDPIDSGDEVAGEIGPIALAEWTEHPNPLSVDFSDLDALVDATLLYSGEHGNTFPTSEYLGFLTESLDHSLQQL